jgi:hypothetical protein
MNVRFTMIPEHGFDTLHARGIHPSIGNTMNDPKQQAEQFFKEQKPTSTLSEYQIEQEKIRANLERLREERPARETGSNNPTQNLHVTK